MLLLKHVGLPIPNSVFLWVAGCFCAANPRNLRWKKVAARPRLAPCLKMCLKQCFVHIECIEYAKTYSSYPKFIGTHGKNPIQKAQQLRVTNSFSKINAWMPYIQSTTAHVCNYIWGCSGHAEGTCWMDFKGLTQSSPARKFLSFCPGFSLAGTTLSLERRLEEMIKWWVDHKHQYQIDRYMCVCAFRIIQIYSII